MSNKLNTAIIYLGATSRLRSIGLPSGSSEQPSSASLHSFSTSEGCLDD